MVIDLVSILGGGALAALPTSMAAAAAARRREAAAVSDEDRLARCSGRYRSFGMLGA